MKLLNYIWDNNVRFWSIVRKFCLWILLLWIVWIVVAYFFVNRYIWSDSMVANFSNPEFETNIAKIWNILTWDEYLKYNKSEWFTTNKTGVIYQEDNATVIVNLSGDMNWRYGLHKNGAGITNKDIFYTNNWRQQGISRDEIFSWLNNIWSETWDLIDKNIYTQSIFSGIDILSGETIYINSHDTKLLSQNIYKTVNDAKFWNQAKWDIGGIFNKLILPLIFALLFVVVLLCIVYVWIFVFYILITLIIWSIFANIKTFEKAVSISRLPFILKELIQIVFSLGFLSSLLIYILMIVALCYYDKRKNKDETSLIIDKEINWLQ